MDYYSFLKFLKEDLLVENSFELLANESTNSFSLRHLKDSILSIRLYENVIMLDTHYHFLLTNSKYARQINCKEFSEEQLIQELKNEYHNCLVYSMLHPNLHSMLHDAKLGALIPNLESYEKIKLQKLFEKQIFRQLNPSKEDVINLLQDVLIKLEESDKDIVFEYDFEENDNILKCKIYLGRPLGG